SVYFYHPVSHIIDVLFFVVSCNIYLFDVRSFPTRRSSDLLFDGGQTDHRYIKTHILAWLADFDDHQRLAASDSGGAPGQDMRFRSEEHTSELQSLRHLVCRLLLEKKKNMMIWIVTMMNKKA